MSENSVLALPPVLPHRAASSRKDTDQECQGGQEPAKAGSEHAPIPAIGPQGHRENTGDEENEGYDSPSHHLLGSVEETALRIP